MLKSASLTRRSLLSGLAITAISPKAFAQGVLFQPKRYARGARVPAGLQSRVEAQNETSANLDQILHQEPELLKALSAGKVPAAGLPSRFDWRDFDKVTSIKKQGDCGSCWVFAAVAAFESAYLIASNQEQKIADLHISEKQALDCSFFETNCVFGGWHEVVFTYFYFKGAVGNDIYPYNWKMPIKEQCLSDFGTRPYRMANWDYVKGGTQQTLFIPPDNAIKQAILKYGPVVSSVVADKDWEYYDKDNPNWSTDYPNAVFKGTDTNNYKEDAVNHEVLIVGWDDRLGARGAWIIKNSWGAEWGDGGYINLAFGSNYIGLGASWVRALPPTTSIALIRKLETAAASSRLATVPQIRSPM